MLLPRSTHQLKTLLWCAAPPSDPSSQSIVANFEIDVLLQATQSVETAADSNPVAPPPVEATKGAGEGGGARDSRCVALGLELPTVSSPRFTHNMPWIYSFLPGMGGHAGTNVAHTDFREGDWVCPRDECRNHNFASRLVCRRCPQVRPGVDPEQARMQQQQHQYGGGGGYGGGGPPGRHHQNMRPGDWICPDPSCANLNFASRSVCRMCPIRKQPLFFLVSFISRRSTCNCSLGSVQTLRTELLRVVALAFVRSGWLAGAPLTRGPPCVNTAARPAGVGPPGMHGGGGGGGGGFPRDMRPGAC